MKVEDVMVRAPVMVQPDATIEQAAQTMAREGVGSLIVSDEGRLAGVVTDRDLVVRAIARGVPVDARIDAVMSMNVIALEAHSDVRNAARAFSHHAVRRMPVVDGAHIVGMVSVDDLIVAAAHELGEITKGVTAQLLFPRALDEPAPPARVS
jgi:signal-transduction protein with cAMP-binding, CBS, and nucleotidyltransferase domain